MAENPPRNQRVDDYVQRLDVYPQQLFHKWQMVDSFA